LNSTRKAVKSALEAKDEVIIRRLAWEQVEVGADILDVKTATSREKEIDVLSKGYRAMSHGYCIGEDCLAYTDCGGTLIYWWSPGFGKCNK